MTESPMGVRALFTSPTSRVASWGDIPTPAPNLVRKRGFAVPILLATPSAKLTVIFQRGNLSCPPVPGVPGPKIAVTSRTGIPRRTPPMAFPGIINVEAAAPVADSPAPAKVSIGRLGTSSSGTNTLQRKVWRIFGVAMREIRPGPSSRFVDIGLDILSDARTVTGRKGGEPGGYLTQNLPLTTEGLPSSFRQPGQLASVAIAGLSRGFASPNLFGFAFAEAQDIFGNLWWPHLTTTSWTCQGSG